MTEAALELRTIDEPGIELRADGADGMLHFSGYAAVFNAPSQPLPFVETLMPGAFARSLTQAREIPFLINHDKARLPLAVSPKTLKLSEDDHGLRVDADLVPSRDALDLKMHADAGNVHHMSFAFKPTPKGETWTDGGRKRDLHEVRLHEVSVLLGYAPAYRQTTAYIRSLAEQQGADPDELTMAINSLADGRPLTDEEARLLAAAVDDLRVRQGPTPTIRRLRLELEEKLRQD